MAITMISGSHGTAITLTTPTYGSPVTNTGTIAIASGSFALGATTDWTIVNEGRITGYAVGGDYGVYLNSGAITNAQGATITGGGALEIKTGAGVVLNSGLLAGAVYGGAFLYAGGYVSNATTGTITGGLHAVGFQTGAGTLVNNGSIADTGKGDVVLLAGGTVVNGSTGMIRQAADSIYVTGASGVVVNSGYLYSTTAHAVELDHGGSVTNLSGGTILGQHAQIYSASLNSKSQPGSGPVTLTNYGLIAETATTSSAVALKATVNGGGTVSNLGGTIDGAGRAIVILGGLGSVYNTGLLTAGQYGVVNLLAGGTIDNATGGRILGNAPTSAGVYVTGSSGVVINRGTIANVTSSGVALFSGGTVQDYGNATIAGGSFGLDIKGAAGTVQTAGTIMGGNGTAVALAAGYANRVDYAAGAVFQGIVDGGNAIGAPVQSTLSLSYYNSNVTGTLTNLNSTFVNFQQIEVRGAWAFTAVDTLLSNVTLTDLGAGSKHPAGTVGGDGLMLNANDTVTVASGALVSRATAPTKRTAGIIALSGASNVYIANGGLVTNPTNTYAAGIGLFDGGTIVNGLTSGAIFSATGTIIGRDVGIYATASGFGATIVNPGTIAGLYSTSSGIDLKAMASVGNVPGGTIIGAQNGLVAEAGGIIVNDGLIAGTDTTNSQGIYLNGGTVTNLASGTISGVVGIQAGQAGPATVVDAGTITGSSYAIQFRSAVSNLLVLDPGAEVLGTVGGQNTLNAGFLTTLQLATGTGIGTLDSSVTHLRDVYQIDVNAGADWVWTGSGATLAAGAILSDLGALTLASGLAGSGEIMLGANATLAVLPGAAPSPTISSFGAQETIEVLGAAASGLALAGSQLTVSGTGVTLNINTTLPAGDFSYVVSNNNTYIMACFAAGTRLSGAFGKVPVEALQVGDKLRTASGRLATIRWLGHRRTHLRQHPKPYDVMPVRIHAGAFGDNQPSRDLVLSPDHAVFVDGYLVPIRYLVNGQSIVQETRDHVTYWHVELERHDVLLAEDLPCESYLDTGNRAAFENAEGPTELHPDFARRIWQEQGCAPILVDPAAPALRAIHLRLLAHARWLATSRPAGALA
ncbi:MAG: Hint domain-containing protein [Rhodospirillales bacterium]|nr:Hint domain-containing protein [Rhodospirillales bacterium]